MTGLLFERLELILLLCQPVGFTSKDSRLAVGIKEIFKNAFAAVVRFN